MLITVDSIVNGDQIYQSVYGKRRQSVDNDSSAKPQSFKDIFGDLSEHTFLGPFELEGLDLNSLEGCPREIQGGYFSIEGNPNLKTFDFFPECLAPLSPLFIDLENIETFKSVDINSYKHINRFHINLSVARRKLSMSEKIDLVVALSDFREWKKDFESVSFVVDSETDPETYQVEKVNLETLYLRYKSVDYDREKLEKLLTLIQ